MAEPSAEFTTTVVGKSLGWERLTVKVKFLVPVLPSAWVCSGGDGGLGAVVVMIVPVRRPGCPARRWCR